MLPALPSVWKPNKVLQPAAHRIEIGGMPSRVSLLMKGENPMSQSATRILTTHVGSLIRPVELLTMIEAKQDGASVDDAIFAGTLRSSVIEIVRQQADAGIDIVSDGEFGKTGSWSRYVVERLSGIEFRPGALASISSIRGKDFRDFEEFYIEYENEHGAAGLGKSIAPAGGWAITGPITYEGQAQIGRDIANLKAALEGSGVTAGFLPLVAPASVLPARSDEYYKTEEEALFASSSSTCHGASNLTKYPPRSAHTPTIVPQLPCGKGQPGLGAQTASSSVFVISRTVITLVNSGNGSVINHATNFARSASVMVGPSSSSNVGNGGQCAGHGAWIISHARTDASSSVIPSAINRLTQLWCMCC